jgi:hypothetical protein
LAASKKEEGGSFCIDLGTDHIHTKKIRGKKREGELAFDGVVLFKPTQKQKKKALNYV